MSDVLGSILTISWVLIFLIISEGLATLDKISKENARKLIHIGVGNVVLFIPLFDTRWIAAGIPAIFVVGNYLLSPMSPIEKLQLRTFKAGHAWGTILYPLTLSLSVFLFYNSPWIIVAVFFPVVYGDGFAAVFGPKVKDGTFEIREVEKTLLGTTIISLFTWGSVSLGIILLGNTVELAIITGIITAILSPFIEIVSPKGTDNFVLPVTLSAIFLGISSDILEISQSISAELFLISILLGLIFSVGGYLAKVLTPDGAVAGFMITLLMLGIGGATIGAQLFLFFILGSGATKIVKNIAGDTQDEFEKGGERRDAIQALAKAGIPALLSIFYLITSELWIFYIITGVMAAALIDTMATEVGIASRGTPVHVLSPWKRAETGQTGVISLKGTLGGMAFGWVFVTVVYLIQLIDPIVTIDQSYIIFVVVIISAGIIGMLADSIIGTTIQRHNTCQVCGKIVEASIHHETETMHTKGIGWLNNDITNTLGTSIGGLTSFLLYLLYF